MVCDRQDHERDELPANMKKVSEAEIRKVITIICDYFFCAYHLLMFCFFLSFLYMPSVLQSVSGGLFDPLVCVHCVKLGNCSHKFTEGICVK